MVGFRMGEGRESGWEGRGRGGGGWMEKEKGEGAGVRLREGEEGRICEAMLCVLVFIF